MHFAAASALTKTNAAQSAADETKAAAADAEKPYVTGTYTGTGKTSTFSWASSPLSSSSQG